MPFRMRPLVATIDLAAIRHNYAVAKRCAPGRQAFAVVKANAYGHGVREVVTALSDQADGFAVACLEEAVEVRALHGEARILLLEGCFGAAEYQLAAQLGLDLVLQGEQQAAAFLAAKLSRPLAVWLKLDSGMHRLGFDARALRAWQDRKSTRLNSSHSQISYAGFCLEKNIKREAHHSGPAWRQTVRAVRPVPDCR